MATMFVLLATIVSVVLGVSGFARAETMKLYAVEDGWANLANPSGVYGNNTYLSVNDRTSIAECFLKFPSENILSLDGRLIENASLWLYQYQATYSPGDTLYVHAITQDWDENALSWNTKPSISADAVSSLDLTIGNECWREFSGLEAVLASWRNGQNYGLCLENNLDNNTNELFARFYSSEAAPEYRPYLSITANSAAPEPLAASLFIAGGIILSLMKRGRTC
jgi:hypothetical protein